MKNAIKLLAAALALCPILLLLLGCGRVNQENYDRLQTGMKYEEVVDILGKPEKCSQIAGIKSCLWGDETSNIQAGFMGDTAVVFSATGLK
ncbi:MAG: DUF3862 domain-containing protein [Syntrophotaleaceae bacterium]